MAEGQDEFFYGEFPDDFMWGTSTSAYQVEGGWDADGKGLGSWDKFTHAGGNSFLNQTGDIACDSYHKTDEDVKLLKNLGVGYYRFSISWSRILPEGTLEKVNSAGVKYYNDLINALLESGITPMVALYHFDLPQALQDRYDGWLNPEIADVFNDYAKFCFETFGDRVKWWITINEPWEAAFLGHGLGVTPPGKKNLSTDTYKVAYVMLLAHAKAWHTYDQVFRATQQGKVSIILNVQWGEPKTDKEADKEAADRSIEWWLGWFANPVFVNGDWPDVMKKIVKEKSEAKGIPNRLPEINEAEKQLIQGTADFFALNMYTAFLVEHKEYPSGVEWNYLSDQQMKTTSHPSWRQGATVWLFHTPWAMRKLLNWVKEHYDDPEIIITENGFAIDGESDLTGEDALNDTQRVEYLTSYVNEALKAIHLDGVRLKGYFLWCLLDNFDWMEGYRVRFGIHRVDFSDPNRPRTPKRSAEVYKEIIRNNGFPKNLKEKSEL